MFCKRQLPWIPCLVAIVLIEAVVVLNYLNYNSIQRPQRNLISSSEETYRSVGDVVVKVVQNETSSVTETSSPSCWPPKGVNNSELFLFTENRFILRNSSSKSFLQTIGNITCLKYGTYGRNDKGKCLCNPGWYGVHCDIPESVLSSPSYQPSVGNVKLSVTPRRIINAFTFNKEWSMLEARINELGWLVDVFIILESNYTLYGDPKELTLLKRLNNGYLKEFHHKIMYVFLDHFPDGARENGWIAEDYGRNYLLKKGVQQLKGTSPRDLFVYNDADEVPSFESMLFLKLHEGYSEPVGFMLNWACFGFFWTQNKLFQSTSVCSLQFLDEIAGNDVSSLRGQKYLKKKTHKKTKYGVAWYIGTAKSKGGWHCSWCMPVEDVQNKLVSAINGDFPRWGDYPEKRKLPYIRNLIKTGTWFNDKKLSTRNVSYVSDPSIAPEHFLNNAKHFRFLLDVKYVA